jgi:chromosome segregation ATPase
MTGAKKNDGDMVVAVLCRDVEALTEEMRRTRNDLGEQIQSLTGKVEATHDKLDRRVRELERRESSTQAKMENIEGAIKSLRDKSNTIDIVNFLGALIAGIVGASK